MKVTRRKFLLGTAAATVAATGLKPKKSFANDGYDEVASLIDLTLCNGCQDQETPLCVSTCRTKNADRFPEPDPEIADKDYWPQKKHEDWRSKKHLTNRLTPYNWTFVQSVKVNVDGKTKTLHIPRRCMHCEKPPCVNLCPFGTMKKTKEGPVYVDESLCMGGAKCRTVCPWSVPQRQSGVGIYTHLQPLPVGGGCMYKCDLCRDSLKEGKPPACSVACPQKAILVGPKQAIVEEAQRRAEKEGLHLYGLSENGGTGTIYLSEVPFEQIDKALIEQAPDASKVMRLHNPENVLSSSADLATAALLGPALGAAAAFAATIAKGDDKDE